MTIGVLFIYSSNVTTDGTLLRNEHLRQIGWAFIGLVLMIAASLISLGVFKDTAVIVYVAVVALLVLTLLFGRVVGGARRWIGIAGLGLQPSEFAKLATILLLARTLAHYGPTIRRLSRFMMTIPIALLPMLLVLVQPDLGTALVFLPVFFAMAFAAGAQIAHVLFFAASGLAVLGFAVIPPVEEYILVRPHPFLATFREPRLTFIVLASLAVILGLSLGGYYLTRRRMFGWFAYAAGILKTGLAGAFILRQVLRPYQIMRFVVFLNPQIDPQGAGWNTIQSVTAVGAGGVSGLGFLQGTQSQYQYLPQQSTDFIFSVLAEETGFLGVLVLFSLYFYLLLRGLVVAARARDSFGSLLATGMTTLLALHFFVNVGMAIGIMPVTGLPLYFVSFGGSAMWAASIAVGMILNVHAERVGAMS